MTKNKIEKILIILSLIGFIFKVLSIQSANLILIFSLTGLAMFYFIGTFFLINNISIKKTIKGQKTHLKTLRIIGSIGFGIGLSAILVGILFSLNIWPGGRTNIIFGLSLVIFILVISLIRFIKNKSIYYKSIFLRGIIYSVIALILIVLPKYWILNIQYRNFPDYKNKVIESYEKPNDTIVMQQLEKELIKMERKIE